QTPPLPGPPSPRGPLLRGLVAAPPSTLLRPPLPVSAPPPDFPEVRLYGWPCHTGASWLGSETFPLSPLFLFPMQPSPTPESPTGASIQFFPAGSSLRPHLTGSALSAPPSALASCFAGPGGMSFRGSIGQPGGSLASWTDRLGSLPAAETFTPELSSNDSPPLDVGYDCDADWTIAPAGLPPAGTAASWAALDVRQDRAGHPALRRTAERGVPAPVLQVSSPEHVAYQPQQPAIVE